MNEADYTILNVLARNAAHIPDRTALVYGNTKYTWREFDEITDRAAAALFRKGMRRGECVGIQTISGMGIVAIWAAVKTGAAYLPLNPVFPEERLMYMRDNAGVKYTLFDRDIEKLTGAEKGELPHDITGQDRLAVMYTSGSTGTPKSVTLFHRDAMPYARNYINAAGLTEKDKTAMYVGFSFVVHILDLYAWVLSGAALHVLSAEIKLDIRQIAGYFNEHAITAAIFPTGMGKKILSKAVIPSLKVALLAGEKLTVFKSVNTELRVLNGYGCTECAGVVSAGEVYPESNDIHVGKGADGIGLEIIDESGTPVPDGTEGELWITLFGRLHKTGDLAKRNKDGNIVIIGRKDFQLNVRGYRIEPGEIEACLLTFPGMIEAVAVTRGERLVAYYAAEGTIQPQALKSHLSRHLPPYMIPSVFVVLDKLPRNTNGKIDRAALPEPVYPKAEGEMPQNEIEERLAAIWSGVLGLHIENITRCGGFYELGGDSLSLSMLAVEIEETFHTTVTPAELLQSGTLAKQAELIKNRKEFTPVFTFRAEGNGEPLFFAHTANSGPEVYAKFAGMLPWDQPFYAFEHYNLVHSKELGIRELARIYADEMLKMYPHKPCSLGGWSLGGLISFEMALILEQKGFPIKHVYLVDPHICGDEERDIYAKLDSLPYYREYLESGPLFTRFRDAGRIERLISNNAFSIKESSQYKPRGALICPVTLFRLTLPDSAEHASGSEQSLLTRLWELKKPDNGFGAFTKNLKIINVTETHDRAMVDNSSLAVIVKEINSNQEFID